MSINKICFNACHKQTLLLLCKIEAIMTDMYKCKHLLVTDQAMIDQEEGHNQVGEEVK